MATQTSKTLVGRDTELTDLESWLREAADEGRSVSGVLLGGDAGVGKTRLLAEARDRLAAEGWRIVVGHCLDLGDTAPSYLPFSEVLDQLATELPDTVSAVAGHHPALTRLQPGRRMLAAERAETAGVERSDLFAAVHALLEEAATTAPLVLVVEDTHWADRSTRELLTFLLTRRFAGPVVVIVSYRADDLHRRHPLRGQVAEWSRLPGIRRLTLGPLADPAVRELIAELAPEGLDMAETVDIVDRAEGNAFFVEELTSAAAGPGRWVPADLADVLLVRLDRLGDDARAVVRTASVAGRRVSHELLAAASGLPEAALDEGLRQAVEMNVLVPDRDRYAFRHALLGEAVYDDLLPGERVRLHDRFAAALRGPDVAGTAAELARHARLAHDLDTALLASIRAGHDALAVGGPDEAAFHYQQALELVADPKRAGAADVDRAALVVGLADALTASGRPHKAVAVLTDEISRLPADAPAAWRSRMLSSQAYLMLITESEVEPVDVSTEAVRLAPADDVAVRARVLATHAKVLAGYRRLDEAQAVGLEALSLAERLNLTDVATDLVLTLSQARHTGPRAGLREALADAVDTARSSGVVEAELRGHFLLGRSYEDHAEWDDAAVAFRRAVDRAAEAGLPLAPYAFESRWHLVFQLLVRGGWDDALALARPADRLPPIFRAMLDVLALQIEHARGHDVADRLPPLRPLWTEEGLIAIHAAPLQMRVAALRHDTDAVLASYDDAVAVLSRLWTPWFSARIRLGAVAIGALADSAPSLPSDRHPVLLERAEKLHADGLVVLARQQGPAQTWGPEGHAWVARNDAELLRLRWLVGEPPSHESLVEAWREAERLTDEFGDVHELARVRAVLAGVLRAAGETAAAREAADLARETASALGAEPLLEQLRGLGATVPRQRAGSTQLTPREQEILTLVAAGRTNGEIGKQLFIATKTVSVHVSNILGKLGAAGRTEAAAIARRDGLLD
ncbi:ATP-binding protein [Nocardioides sp. GXQ0305]|uniref:ATP-binding protein n=1 Tax=Nocardioides sp. GXQ0305 TaxID=3423912 RepID=UPI003D7E4BD9